ncbi:Uncharacterised protein [Mycobacterium tuberculosis]|nr:Uncharacterised protein [Mycobacterium tuberculosis]
MPRPSQSPPYAPAATDSSSDTNAAAPIGRSHGFLAMPRSISGRSGSGASSTGTGAVRWRPISPTWSSAV